MDEYSRLYEYAHTKDQEFRIASISLINMQVKYSGSQRIFFLDMQPYIFGRIKYSVIGKHFLNFLFVFFLNFLFLLHPLV